MKIITVFISMLLIYTAATSNAQGTWTQKADFGGTKRTAAIGFSIGTKGYLGTGYNKTGLPQKDFWQYDQETDTWMQIADFGGNERLAAVAFSIGGKGYAGTGIDLAFSIKKDFWEYDPSANTWTQIADFTGSPRYEAVAFAAGGKGYVGTGLDFVAFPLTTKTFYEYDPQTDSWLMIDDLPGSPRSGAAAFSIDEKGYVGTGYDNNFNYFKDFWEYNPVTGNWTPIADFGGTPRFRSAAFSLGGKGYIGAGYDTPNGFRNDFWQYDPVLNQWFPLGNIGGGGVRESSVGFTIGSKGYIGAGDYSVVLYKDFWEFTPECSVPYSLSVISIKSTSAKISWAEADNVYGYKVRYKPALSSDWTVVQSIDNDKTLSGLMPETEYAWQVKSICGVEPIISSEWSEKQFFTTNPLKSGAAINSERLEVYPNPIATSATISFTLSAASAVSFKLFSVDGKEVMTIADENFSEGNHSIGFDAEKLTAGIYFVQLSAHTFKMITKLVIQ